MGKGANTKAPRGRSGRDGKYVHKNTYNPKARESDERKIALLKTIEVKRFQKQVDGQLATLRSYLSPEERARRQHAVKAVDPAYQLKGAARPAQEFYRPPGWQEDVPEVDMLALHRGRLWDDCPSPEGRLLLRAMSDLSVALHSSAGKTRAAIDVLTQMLELDGGDALCARHRLLRCYLDLGEAGHARALLDRFPSDAHCCMVYSRALVELVALQLEEADASEDKADAALTAAHAANPFALWVIACDDAFTEGLGAAAQAAGLDLDAVADAAAAEGSVVDALRFADVDLPIWGDADGATDFVRDFVRRRGLQPPTEEQVTAVAAGDGEVGAACAQVYLDVLAGAEMFDEEDEEEEEEDEEGDEEGDEEEDEEDDDA
jgi:hypothetical protein